jgi:hypothetical protein
MSRSGLPWDLTPRAGYGHQRVSHAHFTFVHWDASGFQSGPKPCVTSVR